jgi:hypothetical protein
MDLGYRSCAARPMSQMGQNAKYSARADVFRSSPKNGRWFSRPQNIALWNFDRARLPLCANRNRRLGAHRRKAAPRRLCSIALSQASLLRGNQLFCRCDHAGLRALRSAVDPGLDQFPGGFLTSRSGFAAWSGIPPPSHQIVLGEMLLQHR